MFEYQPYVSTLNLSGLKFPMAVNQMTTFERNNQNIAVNVYALAEDKIEIIPRYIMKRSVR